MSQPSEFMTSIDLDAEVPLHVCNDNLTRSEYGRRLRTAAYRAGLEAAAKFCEDSELPRGDLLADQIRALKDRVHG